MQLVIMIKFPSRNCKKSTKEGTKKDSSLAGFSESYAVTIRFKLLTDVFPVDGS